jgi:hypothetical protein
MDVTYNLGISNCVKLLLNKFARLDNREDCLQFVREVELVVTNLRQKSRRRSFQHDSTATVKSSGLRCRPSTRKGYVPDLVGLVLELKYPGKLGLQSRLDF